MYSLSQDYNLLFDLLNSNRAIVCFVDYQDGQGNPAERDVCLARKPEHNMYIIGVRGICYISLLPLQLNELSEFDVREQFIIRCKGKNLGFILP